MKEQTDKAIDDAQLKLAEVERQQQGRQSSKSFFFTLVPRLSNAGTQSNSQCDLASKYQYQSSSGQVGVEVPGSSLALPHHYKEPNTSLTKGSVFTFAQSTNTNASIVQHMRHRSQGPMRSEKVYMMTQLIHQKLEQLTGEKHLVKNRFQHIDEEVARQKRAIIAEYEERVVERDALAEEITETEGTYAELEAEESAMKAKYEKMMLDMQDRIKVLKLGQEKTQSELK